MRIYPFMKRAAFCQCQALQPAPQAESLHFARGTSLRLRRLGRMQGPDANEAVNFAPYGQQMANLQRSPSAIRRILALEGPEGSIPF